MEFDSFVLAAATGDLADEPAARPHSDAVEFRMDLAEEPLEALENYDGDLPVIATNRPEWEGGGRDDGEQRIEELQAAIRFDAVEAVDVELGSLSEATTADGTPVLQDAAERDLPTIVSYHDFDDTPSLSELAEIGSQVCTLGTVGKLSVTATGKSDVLDLLRVTHEFTAAGQSIATMAMGVVGKHSRVVAPLYGSTIGYAPVDPDDATAPGQFDLETMVDLIKQLE